MSFDEPDTTEAHEKRITRCRSCNARIVFLKTASGKNMPVDAGTVEATDTEFDSTRHKSHFAECPNANQHRKSRK
jgi:hypothetical protein